jgi:beta-glucosidase
LAPGEVKQVVLDIDPRLLAEWKEGGWHMPAGAYRFALGDSADRLGPAAEIGFAARNWRESGTPAR